MLFRTAVEPTKRRRPAEAALGLFRAAKYWPRGFALARRFADIQGKVPEMRARLLSGVFSFLFPFFSFFFGSFRASQANCDAVLALYWLLEFILALFLSHPLSSKTTEYHARAEPEER